MPGAHTTLARARPDYSAITMYPNVDLHLPAWQCCSLYGGIRVEVRTRAVLAANESAEKNSKQCHHSTLLESTRLKIYWCRGVIVMRYFWGKALSKLLLVSPLVWRFLHGTRFSSRLTFKGKEEFLVGLWRHVGCTSGKCQTFLGVHVTSLSVVPGSSRKSSGVCMTSFLSKQMNILLAFASC